MVVEVMYDLRAIVWFIIPYSQAQRQESMDCDGASFRGFMSRAPLLTCAISKK